MKSFCSFAKKGVYEYCQHDYMCLKKLRIKIISFGDSNSNAKSDYLNSKFFELPDEIENFENFLNGLEANLKWGDKRNALEALAMAMRSEWYVSSQESDRVRHCIVILTDGNFYSEIEMNNFLKYDCSTNMPGSYDELLERWGEKGGIMNPFSKRLLIIGPEESGSDFIDDFSSCLFAEAKCGAHLQDWTFYEFLKFIIYEITH